MGRKKVLLKRGQFIFGRIKAAQELNMPPSTIWDYMKILESNGCLDISSTSRFSIITIKNWDYYQLVPTGVSATNEQQMDTNKNEKNEKNLYITKNRNYKNKMPLWNRGSNFRRGYIFNPNVGSRDTFGFPTEEEKRTIVPELKEEYKKFRAELEKKGIIFDEFKMPTETEFILKRVREIRKKRTVNNTKAEVN